MFTILSITVVFILSIQDNTPQTYGGRPLDAWLTALHSKSSRERRAAVVAVTCFGPEAKAAVPDLIEILRNDNGGRDVVQALGRIGPDAASAVPLLIERFLKEGCLRHTATGAIGYDLSVSDALVRIGAPAVPSLVEILNGPDAGMGSCAAETLGKMGPAAGSAVPSLLRAIRPRASRTATLDREDRILRSWAVNALGEIGPPALEAVPILQTMLDEKQEGPDVLGGKGHIVGALTKLGSPPIAKLLEVFLRDGDTEVASHLIRLGPKAKPAVPALRGALADKRLDVRISAAIVLAWIEPHTPEAIPILIDAVEHQREEDWGADKALGQLGPAAREAIAALLARLVKGGEFSHRGEIAKTLVRIDPEGKQCLPAIIEVLKVEEEFIVADAADALALLGPRAKAALSALDVALSRKFEGRPGNQDPNVSVARALARIGPEAVPALIEGLKFRRKSEDDEPPFDQFPVVRASAEALGSFGAASKAAVPALIEALIAPEKEDNYWLARAAVARALGQIGPDAKAAIPILRSLRDGKHYQVSDAAAIALISLEPDGRKQAEAYAELDVTLSMFRERRAILLGALGKRSLEADEMTRRYLLGLDRNLSGSEFNNDITMFAEDYFIILGQYGVGARTAVPRLKELRQHPNPWIRLWAGETLERIAPGSR